MNKINFEVGFSVWVIILFGFIALLIVFNYYKLTNPIISNKWKLLLGIIRFLALTCLFLILSEPIISIIKNSYQKPKIALLIDNSKSMNFSYERINKREQLENLLSKSNALITNKFSSSIYTFGSKFKSYNNFSFDSINLNEEETNLYSALRTINNLKNEENIQALVLVSDGIYNSGENPIPLAFKLGIPITTIAIGDTTSPKDVAITSIITNDETFVGKEQPVKVNIKTSGYQSNLKVRLFEEANIIEEKSLDITRNIEDYSIVFTYKPKKEGSRKLTVRVDPLSDEFTTINNQQSMFIKVRKNKNKFVIFSGYPNPDVAYLNRVISSQEGNEVKLYVQKKFGEFYTPQPSKKDLEEANIIIIMAFPISSTPSNILDWITEELAKKKPLLFISGYSTDYNKLKKLEEFLPFFVISNNANEFNFTANFHPEFQGNAILKITGANNDIELLNQLPPIFRTELFTRIKPESEVLATIKVNNVQLNEPFLLLRDFQNQRTASFLGYGLFRWQILGLSIKEINNPNQQNIDVGTILLENIINWISTSQENKKFKLNLSKSKITSNEKLGVTAQIFDDAFAPVNDALVKIKIRGQNISTEFLLPQIGNGLYYTEIGPFAEGDYSFEGEAILNNQLLGSSQGRFTVEKGNLEYLDFKTKWGFLNYLSQQTGGKFFLSNQTKEVNDFINGLNLKTLVISQQKDFHIWNSLALMIIAILLFSLEWFLRRRLGLI